MPNTVLPARATTSRFPWSSTWVCSTSRSLPSTATRESSPSVVSTFTLPNGMFTSRRRPSGVWNRCSVMAIAPLRSAPAVAGQPASGGDGGAAGLGGALEGLDQPGVDRDPLARGLLLDPFLEMLGQPQRDPGRGCLIRCGRREIGIA